MQPSLGVRDFGVYIHYPYCLSKCPYCDFVSYARKEGASDGGYLPAVLAELRARSRAFEGRRVATLFFGGGTPSLWSTDALAEVIAETIREFPATSDVEVTVECNPSSLDRDKLSRMRRAGVTRVSVGVQSLRDDALRFLGRMHDARGGLTAVTQALESGLAVSADLIYGLPGQEPDDVEDQVRTLASLGLDHMSCYELTIEPETHFGKLAKVGRLPLAKDEGLLLCRARVERTLEELGLPLYEISNFAKPGFESRHNLGYWQGKEYLGLGCAAVGMLRSRGGGLRYRNHTSPSTYEARSAQVTEGMLVGTECEHEELSPRDLYNERLMLGLRTRFGVDVLEHEVDTGAEVDRVERGRCIERERAAGRLEVAGDRITLTAQGRLFANEVASRLFA